jgi:hypothetical protein
VLVGLRPVNVLDLYGRHHGGLARPQHVVRLNLSKHQAGKSLLVPLLHQAAHGASMRAEENERRGRHAAVAARVCANVAAAAREGIWWTAAAQ